ncbi:MAG: acetyltransferase [Gammaproteobacteria bacterium]
MIAQLAQKKVLLWGASGHAKVLVPILASLNMQVLAFIDLKADKIEFLSQPVFKNLEDFLNSKLFLPYAKQADQLYFALAFGGHQGPSRLELHEKLMAQGLSPIDLIHPRAWVADSAQLEAGVQVLGMAAVSEEVRIGKQSIVNTQASIDHESQIGQGVHIMPGATLAGCVEVDDFACIGSGATVLPRIKIGKGAMVGAGAVVTRDVPAYTTVMGIPAKIAKLKENS